MRSVGNQHVGTGLRDMPVADRLRERLVGKARQRNNVTLYAGAVGLEALDHILPAFAEGEQKGVDSGRRSVENEERVDSGKTSGVYSSPQLNLNALTRTILKSQVFREPSVGARRQRMTSTLPSEQIS